MAEDANARIRVDIDTAAALANIKNLQRQISAFHTSLAKGGAAAAATSLNMQQGLLNSINQTGKFSATIKNVKSTTDSFTDSLQKNKLSMGEYFRYAGASTKTFGRFFRTEFETINKVARERVKDLQTQYIKMGRDANGAMRAIAVRPLALDMENLGTKTQIAAQRQALLNQLLKQGSTNLLNFGKNTQWAGRQLMVGFTIPLVMFGSVAAKAFMDVERQAVRFKRVYGEIFTTTEQADKALQDIKNLGNEFTKYGIAVSKTMELAADIAAMGRMGADLNAQVAETTRLAVLGGVEQQEALKATIAITDAFGVSAEELAGKVDFLNAVENQTITAIEDLTIAIPKAGPVVKQLGGDVEDLAFFLTAMREGGINASEGANALKSGLASLINPTKQASDMLAGFGINITGIVEANAGDVKGLVLDFATALDTLDPLNRARAIEQLFGKFQFSRLSTLFQNVIKEGNQASRVLELTNATTEELAVLSARELKRVEDSPMFKFQKAIEDIKVTLVPLGEAFLKAVTPLLEFGTSILKKFNELDDGAKGFVVGLTAIAGVIGPVFLMGFGLVANGVANIIKMFTFFKTSLNKAGTASTHLGMQTEYMTQQQLEAAAVAASLDQIHQKLRQTFTSEAAAVNALTASYNRSIAAQGAMAGGAIGRTRPNLNLASGIMSVPGPRGAGDVVPAMLSPGEAVIPAKQSKKYSGIISSLIADNVPGFRIGRNPFASMLGRSKVALRMKDSDFSSELAASGKNARYKSAFDTQTGADYIMPSGSPTTRQRELRSAMERDVFGLDPKTTPTSARPTYGYARTPILSSFINKLFGVKGKNFNAVTRNIGEDSLAKYGNIDLVTKGSVAKRSSAFAGDALVSYHWAAEAQSYKRRSADLTKLLTRTGVKPAPMKGASPEQLGSFDRLGSPFKRYDNDAPPYIETYTPGGFAFNEIDKIIARDPAIAKRLKAELRAAGLGGVRVTGSNFAARLFKQLGVPGYEGGTESVGPLTKTAAEQFAVLKKEEISTILGKTRGATESARIAHEGLTYPNAQKELNDFIKTYEDQARADGVPEKKIQGAVKQYRRTEISHKTKDTRTVMIDGTPIEVKNWRAANLVKDFGAINQLISHIEQTNAVDASGKKISGKKLIGSLDPKEIAAMAGISEKEAKKELKKLGRGEHPITARSSKVLMAVADKYLLASKSETRFARVKAMKHMLSQRIADGSFFAAAQAGQLSLPKKLQAKFDEKEAKSQNTYLTGKKKRLGQARSRLIGPDSGVSKPAEVKRTGGSPKDTKLKLIAQGETVLTEETTKNLKKGGTSSIPGVGRIGGMGKFAPLRVAGAYGGIPEGQTQDQAPRREQPRDPVTGRFISSKAQAPQVAPPVAGMPGGGISGKIAGGATAAGMGAMVYGMSGGPGAEMAMMASMPLMMAQMLGKLAPVVLGLAALAAGAFALKNAFDSAEKASRETTLATGASTQAITAFAEFAGKASAGEVMDKRRANALDRFGVQSGKETFGNLFLQSEGAKPILDGLMASVKEGTSSESMVSTTKNQLATAVASGALSKAQAASIAASLGEAIGDRTFGIKVIGELNELIGIDGSNLLENPVEVRVKLIEETNSKLRSMIQSSSVSGAQGQVAGGASLAVAGGTVGGFAGAAAGGAAGAKVVSLVGALANAGKVATTIGRIGALGGPIGLVAGSIAGAAVGAVMLYDGMQKAGAAAGAMSAQGIIALQQNQEMLDSLDLEYEKRIAVAKAAGDLVKANELAAEQESGRQKVLEASRDTIDMLVQQYQAADFFGINPMGESLDRTLDSMYKDDPLMQQVMTGARRDIEASSGTAEQEYTLKLMLASGNVDPGTMTGLMNVFGKDQDAIEKIVNISLNLGSADAGRAFALASLFDDEVQKKEFLARIEAKVPLQARKVLDVFETVQKAGGVLEMDAVLNAYMADETAGDELVDQLAEFKARQEEGPITSIIIQEVFGNDAMNAVMKDWEYFSNLDRDMQTVYMTLVKTAFETVENDPGAYNTWAAVQRAAGKDYSVEAYAHDVGSKGTTEAQAVRELEQDMMEDTSGGGGGPVASSLDDILKKLRDVRKNQVGMAKGFEDSANAINRLFGGGAGINLFSGIENDMRRLGAEEDLIDLIVGMDPEEFEKQKDTLFNFDKQTGEIIGFKEQLQNVGRALSAIALGQYVSEQQKSAKESRNQVLAFNQLRAAGYSVADAYETVQDAAVASAIATGNVTRDQIDTMLQELKTAQSAMKDAARLTPEGLQDVFEDGFNKAMEAFDANEQKLTFEFELKTKEDQAIITAAENEIAKIQYIVDDYEASLRGVERQEEAINKTYDTKLEALEKVRVANQKVLDQEKGRLSVAEAITRGDLAATARAVQDLRQNAASGYFSSQADALNAGRQSALEQVRSESGLSRVEIEEKIKNLADDIFDIEEKTLEPANERVRLAQVDLEARLEEETVLGRTRDEWNGIKIGIDLARVNSVGYKQAMDDALEVVQDVLDAWNGINSKEVVLTTIQRTIQEGDTTSYVPQGPPGTNLEDDTTPPAPAPFSLPQPNAEGRRLRTAMNSDPLIMAAALKASGADSGGADSRDRKLATYLSKVTKEQVDIIMSKGAPSWGSQYGILAPGPSAGSMFDPYGAYSFASGGYISGPGTKISDSIPAMLSNGEYVVKASSVDKFGTQFLDSINAGELPGYRLGGLIRDGGGSSKPAPPKTPINLRALERAATNRPGTSATPATPFQNFEAGFQNIMASVASNPIVQSIGNFINNSAPVKSLIALASTPVEIIGAVAKNFIESGAKAVSQASQGNFIGAAGTMALNALTVMPKSIMEGTSNAFAGVLDSSNARPSMFEQAGQAAFNANLFNAQNDPEMAALGRIIGGSLNIFGDPLTYLGIGAVAKVGTAAKTAAALRNTADGASLGVTRQTVDLGLDSSDTQKLSTQAFQIGSNKPILFEGPGQDFSKFAGPELRVIQPTPANIIEEALSLLSPGSSLVPDLKTMMDNFRNGTLGLKEQEFLLQMQASSIFSDLGVLSRGDLGGLATLISSLAGDARAAAIVSNNVARVQEMSAANKLAAGVSDKVLGDGSVADLDSVTAFRSLNNFKVTREANGDILLDPLGNFRDDAARSVVNWTTGGPVQDHGFEHFGGMASQKIVTPLKQLIDDNGMPYTMYTNDTAFSVNPGQQLRVSNGILVTPNSPANHLAELVRRGIVKPGEVAPPIAYDEALKEVLFELQDTYSAEDLARLQDSGYYLTAGYEAMQLSDDALKLAAQKLGTDSKIRHLGQHTTNDPAFNDAFANLATKLGVNQSLHGDTFGARYEYIFPDRSIGFKNDSFHLGDDFDSLEALRHFAIKGYFRSPIDSEYVGPGLAKGGLVKPAYLAGGGKVGYYPMGGLIPYKAAGGMFKTVNTDSVPAMLTPGEFVVRRKAVQKFGEGNLEKINSGQFPGLPSLQSMSSPSFSSGSSSVSINQASIPSRQSAAPSSNSVYNYSLSVNVASQSDPNAIAQTVMAQLQRVDSQRVRNGRF